MYYGIYILCVYRVHYLFRYKPLCPETWPNWHGPLADGVSILVNHLGYKPEEYKLGRSKIFIRFPKTLFNTEDALEVYYTGSDLNKAFVFVVIVIQSFWRGMKARRRAKRRREAANLIRRLIKGFIYRHNDYCSENEYFIDHVRRSFLMKLSKNLPKSVLDKNWPTPPPSLIELLIKYFIFYIYFCVQMTQKVAASELFMDQKDSYPMSVPRLFLDSRLGKRTYGVRVVKYDRRGFKPRPRQLLLTNTFAVLVDKTKIKQKIDYNALRGISVSSLSDGMIVLHMPNEDKKQKGDVVLHCTHVIELVTKLALMANKTNYVNISSSSIRFVIARGREGFVDFTRGSELSVVKGKRGHLLVVSQFISDLKNMFIF
uniref:TH1 domain-containing protein n=1 Tax=Periophthalmus magnuspinnatus TaxID=409849 RepID=A0A3B3ZEU5_9GOBI